MLVEIKATRQRTGIPFLYITQNVDEAVSEFDEAEAVFAQYEEWNYVARSNLSRGDALANLGRFDEAIKNYDQAKSVADRCELWDCAARSRLSRGIALRNLGRYEQSVADCEQAESIFATLNQWMGVSISRVNRGMALQNLGQNKEAMANYEQARSIIFDICQWSDVTRYTERALKFRFSHDLINESAQFFRASRILSTPSASSVNTFWRSTVLNVFGDSMIWPAFKLSILVTLVATCVVVLLGMAFAFVLAKRKFRGRELLDAIVTLPLVLPPTVTGYYLIVLLGRRGLIGSFIYERAGWSITFTWWAAVIAAAVMSLPLMVKSARAAIESVNPQYEIASYTLGKSELETFFRITLPLASRGVLAGVVLSFARALGEFGATLMLAGNIPGKTQTMPLAIYEAVVAGENRQAQILALVLTAVSVTAIYLTNKLTGGRAQEI